MSQHPVIFIDLLRECAAVLSVAFLDCEKAKIDALVAKIKSTSLKEYISTLITVAVTGTIDVRKEAALPQGDTA